MNLLDHLKLGLMPWSPSPQATNYRSHMWYEGHDLVGTFQIGDTTVLFWAYDDEAETAYVYSVLTDEEAAELSSNGLSALGAGWRDNGLISHRPTLIGWCANGVLEAFEPVDDPEEDAFARIIAHFSDGARL